MAISGAKRAIKKSGGSKTALQPFRARRARAAQRELVAEIRGFYAVNEAWRRA